MLVAKMVGHLPETFWGVADDLYLLLCQTNDTAKAGLETCGHKAHFSSA